MATTRRKTSIAAAVTVVVAGIASVGTVQAIDDDELERRMALADFQQVEKPVWEPARFGELAAEFGAGDTVVTAQGFAPRDTRSTDIANSGPAVDMQKLLEDGDWDSTAFAAALAEHLEVWPD